MELSFIYRNNNRIAQRASACKRAFWVSSRASLAECLVLGGLRLQSPHVRDLDLAEASALIFGPEFIGRLEQVFERFHQLRDPQKSHSLGTGLGLTIAKNLVAAHGGEISVTDAFPAGTCFTVSLPLSNEAVVSGDVVPETSIFEEPEPQDVLSTEYLDVADSKIKEKIAFVLLLIATIIVIAPVVLIMGLILFNGLPATSFDFLSSIRKDGMRAGGIWPAIAFLAFLQVSAVVLNLIPLPPLDGGHVALAVIELPVIVVASPG